MPRAARALPGLRFEAQAPALPEALPRMDVAAFVGFAAAGPIDVPVAVEDAAQFRAIFGDDARLAWDARAGEWATAHLGPAVRAYFRNGGKRCWVVRVAGLGASRASVPVAGVLGWGGGRLWQARGRARSRGSWGDELGAAAAAGARPVPLPRGGGTLVVWQEAGDAERPLLAGLALDRDVAAQIVPGDLLRITVRDAAGRPTAIIFLPVIDRGVPGDAAWSWPCSAPAPGQVMLAARAPLWLDVGLPEGFGSQGVRAWTQDSGALQAELRLGASGSAPAGRATLLIGLDPANSPTPGSLIAIEEEDGAPAPPAPAGRKGAWLVVEECGASGQDLPTWVTGTAHRQRVPPPGETALRDSSCDRVELELWARHGSGPATRLGGLGLAPTHERYWAALPEDEELLGGLADDPTAPHGPLRAVARGLRFPLAGDATSEVDCYAPLGITPSRGGWSTARPADERTALERDGLAPLTAALFFDDALAGLGCETLLPSAEFIAWQSPERRPLRGMHALLWNDEVTVVAVPDAVQPGWDLKMLEPIPAPAPTPLPAAAGCEPIDGRAPGPGDFFARGAPAPAVGGSYSAPPSPRDQAPRWELRSAAPSGLLLAVQRALLRLCAVRGDLLALLSTPGGAREDDAIEHAARLRSPTAEAPDEADRPQVLPLSLQEARALSHGALYHPWLQELEEGSTAVRLHPPDGAVAGVLARRARERGAWVAPANEALRGVVALEPPPSGARWAALQDAQVNAIRQEPRGFLALSEDTLSPDSDLLGIHVRRLLALLRRAALRVGSSYVFEPLSPAFRRMVERGFNELLSSLFGRGAFAGATPERSFQVDAGALPGLGRSGDEGRFFVDLWVAPSEPMRFLRVRLVQSGEHGLVTEGR